MPVTYKAIATVTVSSATAASMEFTSIPSTYTDLVVNISARGNSTQINGGYASKLEFNGSTANLSSRWLRGSGSAVTSGTETYIFGIMNGASDDTASTFGNSMVYIPNYAGATNKSVSIDGVEENNATAAFSVISAGLWSNTAAITSIKMIPVAGSYVQYSTATLYGILKA